MSKIAKGVAIAALIYVTGGTSIYLSGGVLATAAYASFINSLVVGAFLSGVSAQLQGSRSQRVNHTVEYSGTVEPRRIIYGTMQVSGMQCIPAITGGNNNKYLHQILALAGHEVVDITDVQFGQTQIDDADISAITGTADDGKVTAGDYEDFAWIRRYLGTSSQTADWIMSNLSVFSTDHRGRGVAYVALQYKLDEKVYKTGKPEVAFLVRGKAVYDPRLDTSPGANPTNPTYIQHSDNPALCIADYLLSELGLGEDAARIDWDMVVTAADICDETVTIPTASTQARYTCNCVLITTDRYEDNIITLTSAMQGSCLYSGGKWRIRAGAWETESFEIVDASLTDGGIQMQTAFPFKERWNGVRGTFIDPENNYQYNEFPAVQNASYVTADNGDSVFKDVRFNACTDVHEAQRDAILLTRKSRNRRSASIACGMDAWKIRPGETGIVTLTELGWTAQTVRCEGWKFNPQGFVEIVVREELSSDWDDPLEADYVTPLAISNPTPVYFTPAAPSALATLGTPRAVNLTWVAPDLMPTGAQYEIWEYTSSTPFASATKVWTGIATHARLDKAPGDLTTRYYWVRVIMPDGTTGDEYPTGAGVSGVAVPTTRTALVTNVGPVTITSGLNEIAIHAETVTTDEVVEISASFRVVITDNSNLTDVKLYAGYGTGSGLTNSGGNISKSAVADEAITVTGLASGLSGTYNFGLGAKVNRTTGIPVFPSIDITDITVRVTVLTL